MVDRMDDDSTSANCCVVLPVPFALPTVVTVAVFVVSCASIMTGAVDVAFVTPAGIFVVIVPVGTVDTSSKSSASESLVSSCS